MPHRLVNFKFLKENTFGNPSYLMELIELFVATTKPALDDLKRFCQAEKWEELRQMAHKLRSSYSIMGVVQAEAALDALEAFDGNPAGKQATCAAIDNLLDITTVVYKELAQEVELLKK